MEEERLDNVPSNIKLQKIEKDSEVCSERECSFCFYDLYLSAAGCKCSSEKFVCLKHLRNLKHYSSCKTDDRYILIFYTLDELNTLAEALEGNLGSIKMWVSKELGLILDGENGVEECKLDQKTDSFQTSNLVHNESLLCCSRIGTSDIDLSSCSNSQVSSEVIQSSNYDCVSNNDALVPKSEGKMKQESHLDLNIDFMWVDGETEFVHKPDSFANQVISDADGNLLVANKDKVSCTDAANEPDIFMIGSDCKSIKLHDFSSKDCTSGRMLIQDISKKLFGVDLPISKSQSVVSLESFCKAKTANTSSARLSTTDQGNQTKYLGPFVEPINFGSAVFGKLWGNRQAIFPKGFRSRVRFFNVLDPTKFSSYISEIVDAGFLGPLFKVYLEERPSEKFVNVSAEKCWEMVVERLNNEIERLTSAGERRLAPMPLKRINGLEMFGFLSSAIVQGIEALDPNHECVEYWKNKESQG